MIVPLIVLAIGALLAGFINTPWWHGLGHFLGNSPSFELTFGEARDFYNPMAGGDEGHFVNPIAFGQAEYRENEAVLHSEHTGHFIFMGISTVIALAGIGLAYVLHLANRPRGDALPETVPWLARLLEAKYWVDEVYQRFIVEPLRGLGRFFFGFDRFIIDGIVWTIGFIPQLGGFALKLSTQRGYLQGYAVTMLLCIAVILLFMFGVL